MERIIYRVMVVLSALAVLYALFAVVGGVHMSHVARKECLALARGDLQAASCGKIWPELPSRYQVELPDGQVVEFPGGVDEAVALAEVRRRFLDESQGEPVIRVRLSNGSTRSFPKGTSKEDILAALRVEFPRATPGSLKSAPLVSLHPPSPEFALNGFYGRFPIERAHQQIRDGHLAIALGAPISPWWSLAFCFSRSMWSAGY
jgi:hypothetical protein